MVALDDLRQLQRTLAVEKDLVVFWRAFFDLFDREPLAFMEISQPWKDTQTRDSLLEGVARMLNQEVFAAQAALFWIPGARMAHGQLIANGTLMNMAYFAEIGMGTFTFPMKNGQQGSIRITITDLVDPSRRM